MQTPGKQMVEQRASFNEKLAGRRKNNEPRKNKTKTSTNRIKRRELKTRTQTEHEERTLTNWQQKESKHIGLNMRRDNEGLIRTVTMEENKTRQETIKLNNIMTRTIISIHGTYYY